MNPDTFQKLARGLAEQLQAEFGRDCGFAILAWRDGKLNHVTNDRKTLAAMMGTQLVVWATDNIGVEERELANAVQESRTQEVKQ